MPTSLRGSSPMPTCVSVCFDHLLLFFLLVPLPLSAGGLLTVGWIVERAMVRRWPRGGLLRMWWRAIWRANVRLRLLLTVRARVRSGHGDAAGAAWETLTQDTGTRAGSGIAASAAECEPALTPF